MIDYIVYVLIGFLGILFVQYNQKKKADLRSLLGETLAEDKGLKKEQLSLRNAIFGIDERIKAINEQKAINAENERVQHLSLAERALEARKRFDK